LFRLQKRSFLQGGSKNNFITKGFKMKLQLIVVLGLVLLVSQVSAEEKLILKEQKDKISYSLGMNIGNNLKKQSIEVNTGSLVSGIKDALSGSKALMTEQEVNETLTAFQKEMAAQQAERNKILVEKNKKEGEIFLAANKKKEGVVTLPSGLQYKVIKEGTGETPKLTDTVTVNYSGTLIEGTEFDSSYRRGQPATFPVKGVIAGWTEALQLMKVGSKWQLFIPSNLAYGERGAGRDIGPNTTLIFDVELLSIKEGANP
jgi:FKBP-type peptidyl-prolyl cis-trans isomerase FklB